MRCTVALICLFASAAPTLAQEPLSRIGFGSCARQNRPQPIWAAVCDVDPQLFILLGDNIYGDTSDMAVMKQKYDQCAAIPGFKRLCAGRELMATWDDHDYGINDGGVEWKKKDDAQTLFLDFFKVPKDSPRRGRKGVYSAKIFGPEGKRVQVIMLDTRYHRSPIAKAGRRYIPNDDPEATFLGKEQWAWLKEQLKKPAEVRIIGSSIQMISQDHPYEKWMNIPGERRKFYDLVRETGASGVIVLSGDRHLAEVSVMDAGIGYPLYDLTSSGLNQGSKYWRMPEPNRYRVAAVSYGNNFGMLIIDWNAADPLIRMQIRGEEGEIRHSIPVKLSTLTRGKLRAGRVRRLPAPPTGGNPEPRRPDGPPKRVEGTLTPDQAKPNTLCSVKMKVASVGGNTNVYLNSKRNYRDDDNFTIALMAATLGDAMKDFDKDSYVGKTVIATGRVRESRFGMQLLIDDLKKLKIAE